MNDLYYIEYRPELMLSDSMDMDADTELAHRRLCDFIWRMDKAPRADNEFLRQFTKTKPSEWGRVKRGLAEKGWAEVAGLFIHKGAIETLNLAKEKYAASCNQTAPARAKKNGSQPDYMDCQRDPVTGIVAIIATTPVTGSVTHSVTSEQLEPELEQVKNPPPMADHREVPTEEQAVTMAMGAGIEEAFLRLAYRQWAMQSGKNANGVLVNWLPYVTNRWKNEQVEWRNGTHRGNRKHENTKLNGSRVRSRNAGTYNEGADVSGLKRLVR